MGMVRRKHMLNVKIKGTYRGSTAVYEHLLGISDLNSARRRRTLYMRPVALSAQRSARWSIALIPAHKGGIYEEGD